MKRIIFLVSASIFLLLVTYILFSQRYWRFTSSSPFPPLSQNYSTSINSQPKILRNEKYRFEYDYTGWRLCGEAPIGKWDICRIQGDVASSFSFKIVDYNELKNRLVQLLLNDCNKKYPTMRVNCSLQSGPTKICNKNSICCDHYIFTQKYSDIKDKNFFKQGVMAYCSFTLPVENKILLFYTDDKERLDGLKFF